MKRSEAVKLISSHIKQLPIETCGTSDKEFDRHCTEWAQDLLKALENEGLLPPNSIYSMWNDEE